MIAVDTHVLLRNLLDDDAAQSRKARHLFDTNEGILITECVSTILHPAWADEACPPYDYATVSRAAKLAEKIECLR